jgi:hypothetical protein
MKVTRLNNTETPKSKLYWSTEANAEDYSYLQELMDKESFASRRETLAFVIKQCKRSLKTPNTSTPNSDLAPTVCPFLSDDQTLCGKNGKPRKTTTAQCSACQNTQRELEKNQRAEEIKLHGQLLRSDLTERMWISELGVPFEKTGYDTFNRLVYLKELLDQKNGDLATLQNDNDHLREEVKKLESAIESGKLTLTPPANEFQQ